MTETKKNTRRSIIKGKEIEIAGIIIASIIGLGIFYFQRQTNEIGYYYETSKIFENSLDGLQLTYNGLSVNRIYATDFSVLNTGNQPIRKGQIIDGLFLNIGSECQILQSKVIGSTPSSAMGSFGDNLIVKGSLIRFVPALLNPGDEVKIRIISSKCLVNPSLIGRVEGVKEIRYLLNKGKGIIPNWWLLVLIFLLFTSGIIGIDPKREITRSKVRKLNEELYRIRKDNLYDNAKLVQMESVIGSRIKELKEQLANTRSSREHIALLFAGLIVALTLFLAPFLSW